MKQKKDKFLVNIEADQREKRKVEFIFFSVLSVCFLFVLTLGINYGLRTILSLSVSRKTILILCLFSSLWTAAVCYVLNYKKIGYLITGIGTMLFCIWYGRALLKGFQIIANHLLERINIYYRTRFIYFSVEEYSSKMVLLAWGLVIFLITVLCGYFIIEKKHTSLIVFSSLTAMIMGFLLGKMISKDALFLLTGVSFCSLCLERKSYIGKRKTVKSMTLSISLIAGIFILFVLAGRIIVEPRLKQPLEQWHKALYEWDITAGKNITNTSLYQTVNNGLNRLFYRKASGMLTNQEPENTGKNILSVTVKADEINQNLYLKGWVGSTYEDSRWNDLSDENFYQESKNWKLKENTDAGLSVQNLLYEHLKEFPLIHTEFDKHEIFIEQLTDMPYKYVPYGMKLENNVESHADGYAKKDKNTKNSYNGYFIYEDFMNYVLMSVNKDGQKNPLAILWEQERYGRTDMLDYFYGETSNVYGLDSDGSVVVPEDKRLPKEVKEVEENYRAYAINEYTKVPEKGLEKLKEICKGKQFNSIQSAKEFIIDFLHKNTTYSRKLKALSYGEDFVNHFLFEEKKGFCTHYATTATLMFRMLGYPARYVSGYVVTPLMYEVLEDGYFNVKVPDGNAHAWTEVYIDGKGWIPIEATPGYDKIEKTAVSSKNQLGQNVETAVLPTPFDEEKGNTVNQNDKSEQNEEKSDASNGYMQKEIWDFTLDSILIQFINKVIWLFSAVVFAACFLFIRRKIIIFRREKRIKQRNHKEAVKAISHEMHRILEYSGYKNDKLISDEEYSDYIGRQLDYWNIDEYNRFITILREVCFSEQETTREDRVFCLSVYKKVYKNEQKKKKGFERLYWKYIVCY